MRSVLIGVTICLFGYLAYYLYQKQEVKLDYSSFQLTDASSSVFIPDVDKFVSKIGSSTHSAIVDLPAPIQEAFNALKAHVDFDFNQAICKSLFLSYSANDYLIVVESTSSVGSFISEINSSFQTDAQLNDDQFQISGHDLQVQYFGNFICFSTVSFSPNETPTFFEYGNADYVTLNSIDGTATRHVLSKKYHFAITEGDGYRLLGRPVSARAYVNACPADFDQIRFYGSTRMSEDVNEFFKESDEGSFVWLDDGLVHLKKDSFELIIARQGLQRDLDLILQEETLSLTDDSTGLNYFNIGKFKILPFKTDFNWQTSIQELNGQLQYYTEFEDFNIMSNSIPAMRWYLGQVQLGNLFESNKQNLEFFNDCLPSKLHYFTLTKNDSSFTCKSEISQFSGKSLITDVDAVRFFPLAVGTEVIHDFSLAIVPTKIQVFESNAQEVVLANNSNSVSLYSVEGEKKWQLNLSSSLVQIPQIVDFNNDNINEFVLFQKDQIDVVDWFGKSLTGFPVKLNAESKVGLAVNYDMAYNYRLIVNQGNKVKVYSEKGENVDGWVFNQMSGQIEGKIYHVLTEGKDIITFKDVNNKQYVLNRRGESRVDHEINFKLQNETDFVVGGMSNSLRKHGFNNGHIYTYYLLDGELDSVKVDQSINPVKIHWEYNNGKPLMIAEETGRLLIVDEFGYVKSEVLKPQASSVFVGLLGEQDYGFVFADNSQNSIYLLNNYGKMLLPIAVNGSSVSAIYGDLLYTFSGTNIKAYQISK